MSFLSGRMNRATYWAGIALLVLLYGVANLVSERPKGVSEVLVILLAIPRLHDLGKSGWWVLVPLLLEVSAIVVAFTIFELQDAMTLMGAVVLAIAGMVVWLGIVPSQLHANRYGDLPTPGLGFKAKNRPTNEGQS
jgi:uncharacterized membrane protein YhaH (DUF805 family)